MYLITYILAFIILTLFVILVIQDIKHTKALAKVQKNLAELAELIKKLTQ